MRYFPIDFSFYELTRHIHIRLIRLSDTFNLHQALPTSRATNRYCNIIIHFRKAYSSEAAVKYFTEKAPTSTVFTLNCCGNITDKCGSFVFNPNTHLGHFCTFFSTFCFDLLIILAVNCELLVFDTT